MTEINTNQINLAPAHFPELTGKWVAKMPSLFYGCFDPERRKELLHKSRCKLISHLLETIFEEKRLLSKERKISIAISKEKKISIEIFEKIIYDFIVIITIFSSFFNDYQYNKYLRFIRWFASSFPMCKCFNTNENESRINKFIGRTYLSDCGSDKHQSSLFFKKEERKQKGGISKVLLRYNNAFDAVCMHCKYA
jgi:hypothetical protein